jgi:hypothetical protein
MKYLVPLALVATVAAASELHPLVRFGLVDAGFGIYVHSDRDSTTVQPVVPFAIADLAVGVQFGRHVGVAAGTSLLDGNLMWDISYLPVRAYVFCDLRPEQTWRKPFGFICATYVHSGQDGWSGSPFPPYVKVNAGVAYTFYAVTPHAEVGYDGNRKSVTAAAGVTVGGLHIFR